MRDATTKPQEPLSCCPLCGGEIRAILERHYSLCGATWVESGDGQEIYCENDCDLGGYSGQIPDIPAAS
jgi:hypothetical protein